MLFNNIGKLLNQIVIFLDNSLFPNNMFDSINSTTVFDLIVGFVIILLFINYFIFYDENLPITDSETLSYLLENVIEDNEHNLFIIYIVSLFLFITVVNCSVCLYILFFVRGFFNYKFTLLSLILGFLFLFIWWKDENSLFNTVVVLYDIAVCVYTIVSNIFKVIGFGFWPILTFNSFCIFIYYSWFITITNLLNFITVSLIIISMHYLVENVIEILIGNNYTNFYYIYLNYFSFAAFVNLIVDNKLGSNVLFEFCLMSNIFIFSLYIIKGYYILYYYILVYIVLTLYYIINRVTLNNYNQYIYNIAWFFCNCILCISDIFYIINYTTNVNNKLYVILYS